MKVSQRTGCLVILASLCVLLVPLSVAAAPRGESGNIKEVIPIKFQARYAAWKEEFLATASGRGQWQTYEQNPNFTLTITIASDMHNGAATGKYKWDDAGALVAATITLGSQLETGYPDPIYYPVMNSLSPAESMFYTGGTVLAAAKFAHEFGHVKQVKIADGAHYRLQNQLIPGYNKILLSNGRNTGDLRLLELSRQMGGTPVEIWEDREYWGEANAMLFLRDRITKDRDQHALFTRILRNVEMYAPSYAKRFDQIAQK